jgi:hypothetical protein
MYLIQNIKKYNFYKLKNTIIKIIHKTYIILNIIFSTKTYFFFD